MATDLKVPALPRRAWPRGSRARHPGIDAKAHLPWGRSAKAPSYSHLVRRVTIYWRDDPPRAAAIWLCGNGASDAHLEPLPTSQRCQACMDRWESNPPPGWPPL